MKFSQIVHNKIMLNEKKVTMTSYSIMACYCIFFNFCQLWRPVVARHLIFIKNLSIRKLCPSVIKISNRIKK